MRYTAIPWYLVWTIFIASCIEGNDRCGDLTWNESFVSCIGEADTEPSDTNPDEGDGGADTGTDEAAPPILEEECEEDADCAVYHADYCLKVDAATPGFCTLRNCSPEPDNCPDGYVCCLSAMPTFFEDHCMPADVYNEQGSDLCVN